MNETSPPVYCGRRQHVHKMFADSQEVAAATSCFPQLSEVSLCLGPTHLALLLPTMLLCGNKHPEDDDKGWR